MTVLRMKHESTTENASTRASPPFRARELTWRLVAGQGVNYGPEWGNHGRDVIRDDFSRLYLLGSGRIRIETATKTYALSPGELWLIPGGVPARYCCVEPMRLNWVHFNVFVGIASIAHRRVHISLFGKAVALIHAVPALVIPPMHCSNELL